MGAAYSQDLRDRVIAARDRGMKTKPVADLFAVSASWVRRVLQRRREHRETAPRPRGGATLVKIDPDRLRELVRAHPDATARELHALLGIACSVSAVDMALRRAGLTFKKSRSTPPSRTAPTWRSGGRPGGTASPALPPAG
ncbi:MAG: IS630 transposase-related protein [Gemmatimonadales bacterium]